MDQTSNPLDPAAEPDMWIDGGDEGAMLTCSHSACMVGQWWWSEPLPWRCQPEDVARLMAEHRKTHGASDAGKIGRIA